MAVEAKARDYLTQGRVCAERVTDSDATFRVQGSAPAPYLVTRRRGRWHCTCPARIVCCHITACALVTRNGRTR